MKERLFTIVLLLCAFVLNASSQKTATVKSFVQTTDHISGSDRRNDMNGTPCALVKVQVVDDISRVEGNRIGDILTKGVEKWVYMCKGSRNMRIHLKNHLPVKVMFQDYHINGLESNRVYELVIETPDAPIQIDKQQKLVINYTPTNAMVLIDSKPYRGNGRIETELPVGEHRYIIAADGYVTAEGVVKLNEQGTREITERLTTEHTIAIVSQEVIPSKQTSNKKYQDKGHKEKPAKPKSNDTSGLERGFRGLAEVGYAPIELGDVILRGGCGTARAAFGYQINPHIFAGFGVGIGLYDEFDYPVIPVFVNLRYTILNKRISPFVDAKVGYSFGPERVRGYDLSGMYLSPSVGCRFAIGKRMAFTASACLEVQNLSDKLYDVTIDIETAQDLGLRIGLEF